MINRLKDKRFFLNNGKYRPPTWSLISGVDPTGQQAQGWEKHMCRPKGPTHTSYLLFLSQIIGIGRGSPHIWTWARRVGQAPSANQLQGSSAKDKRRWRFKFMLFVEINRERERQFLRGSKLGGKPIKDRMGFFLVPFFTHLFSYCRQPWRQSLIFKLFHNIIGYLQLTGRLK